MPAHYGAGKIKYGADFSGFKMRWQEEAIILSIRKHGENNAVSRVFSREHGVYAGVVKGATSKTNRGILQPGNIVNVTWNARLSEHIGMFKAELLEPVAAYIMGDAMKLAALSSACALIESAMPERHPYTKLYKQFHTFVRDLRGDGEWLEDYVRMELAILAESGFGLDLTQCAATGTTENLIYVSPKSGRAVSREAGKPYKDKLLPLPQFLLASPGRGEVDERSEAGGGKLHPKIDKYGSHSLIPNARDLRGDMPDAEKRLWYYIRAHRLEGYGFRRQHPISTNYIADFICLDKKLIIELDGSQHSEQQNYDGRRTAFLENEGYRVLRFWNNEVLKNIEGVLITILEQLKTDPLPSPPPVRGREEVLAGLRLSGYFLDSWLLSPHNRKLPAARSRLIDMMRESRGQKTASA